jgi:hypothetical protein
MSGDVFLLAGGAISWNSKKQTTIALSSIEAEYAALAHATRQGIWLCNLFSELGLEQLLAIKIFCDNQPAIAISQDPQFHARSKHFDVQNHVVREKAESGIIEITYCPTNEMVAELLTKGLPKSKHQKFLC